MMPAADDADTLSLQRVYPATAARLFSAWTEPDLLRQWWGPPGSKVQSVEVDLQLGGRYRIGILQPNGATYFVHGVYEVVQPPKKLAFTWRWEQPEMDIGESLVTIEFEAHAGDAEPLTAVTLTHEKLPSGEARAAHQEGWVGILDNLSEFLR